MPQDKCKALAATMADGAQLERPMGGWREDQRRPELYSRTATGCHPPLPPQLPPQLAPQEYYECSSPDMENVKEDAKS